LATSQRFRSKLAQWLCQDSIVEFRNSGGYFSSLLSKLAEDSTRRC
jgi:hypothetical protein